MERHPASARPGVTVWLTGLSGAGKSTVARALHERVTRRGRFAAVLDGDRLREGLTRDLGFSRADRRENLRRVAEVARLFNEAGALALCALLSPYDDDRALVAEIVGPARFVLVHVDAPLAVCEARDPKGLYRRARAGELAGFTGVSAPYEAPSAPALRLRTEGRAVDDSVAELVAFLEAAGHLA